MELEAVSHIDGRFTGWDGTSVYRLANGQRWQQARYQWEFSYAYMPEVEVWFDGSRYYLRVEGLRAMVEVRQV
jgi:hypothetical protein